MPISVPGLNNTAQQGFSLLEVLVVLAIIGIVTGTVGLSVRSLQEAHSLHTDARRLAQLFAVAQAQARASGRPVVWEHSPQGYRFSQAPGTLAMPTALAQRMAGMHGPTAATTTGALRPRRWSPQAPVTVRTDPPAARVFHDEWVSGPRMVELHDGLHTVRLLRSGNGQYRVEP